MISSKALARKIFVPFLATLMVAGLSAGLASPAKADATTKQVIIHYQKIGATTFDDYKNLDLYLWNGLSGDFAPNGNDSYGKIWTLSVDSTVTLMEGLIKTGWIGDWSNKDGGDGANRAFTINASGTTEIWLVSGKQGSNVYTSVADAVANGGATAGALTSTGTDPNYDCVAGVCEPHIDMPATQTVTIHYNRPDATGFDSYKSWQVYQFDGGDAWFNGSDSFGKVYTRTLTNATKTTTFGFIIKTATWEKDACSTCNGMGVKADRIITLDKDGSTEVWVVSGASDQYFTSKADATAAGAVASPWAAGATDPNFTCADGVCSPKVVVVYPATQSLTIHYNRPAGDYADWNLWLWGTKIGGTANEFNAEDSYGKKFVWNLTNAQENAKFNFIVRTNNWAKDTPDDRSVTVDPNGSGNYEIWLKQGDATIYTANPYGVPTVSSVGLPASTGYAKSFAISGTNFPTGGNLDVKLVRAAVPAVLATKVGSAWKCGSVTRSEGYVCTAAVPAATAQAIARAVSATSAVVSLPKVTTGFTGKLVVTTPGGSATSTGSVGLTTAANAPAAVVASPAAGVVGDTVTVTATNAGAATSVKLGALDVPFTVTAINKLTFVVPALAADGKISITTAGGTAISSASFALKPSITNVTSSVAISKDITITGVNLGTATAAKIGTKSLVIKSKGATQIVATVPTGSVTGKVSVTTPGGTVVSASDVTVLPVPTITSITGAKTGTKFNKGATLTITGTGLSGATKVYFGANSIADFTVVNSTTITFTAPVNKTGTSVSVETPGGTAIKTGAVSTTA